MKNKIENLGIENLVKELCRLNTTKIIAEGDKNILTFGNPRKMKLPTGYYLDDYGRITNEGNSTEEEHECFIIWRVIPS